MPSRRRLASISVMIALRDRPRPFGRAHRTVTLVASDDLVTVGESCERPADDLLARAVGVHVGGVEEVDAGLDRLTDRGLLLFSSRVQGWVPRLGHRSLSTAEHEPRNLQPCAP